MLKVENIEVIGVVGAMRGMRYPKDSEKDSDSTSSGIGPKDLELLLKLTRAGRDHRKVLRCIHVQASINFPMSWLIQYDTYKVSTTAVSRSRMHRLAWRLLTRDDFFVEEWTPQLQAVLEVLNADISLFQESGKRDMIAWRRVVDLLPMSYCQERFIDINYETLLNILGSRYSEKLKTEWKFFCDKMLEGCPHLREIWEITK